MGDILPFEKVGACLGIDIGLDIQWLYSKGLLDRLLKDKTTGHNILWATDAYSALGMRYGYDEPLSPALITGANAGVIQARAQKGQARRDKRTRQRGEVCTPLWVVKKMVNYADEVWFGAPGRFFDGDTPTPRVRFEHETDWQRYVDSRRLEITCGEAPYLVTRYDVESGERIPLARRIGILDRKLRAVNENAADAEWLHWTARAFEACYGYELQGDSLLTARVNLLMTFVEYYQTKWGELPPLDLCRYIANRIAWNVWQMDGLTGTLPCAEQSDPRLSLAELAGAGGGAPPLPPPRCRIYNWRGKRSFEYLAMQQKGARTMRFDYILGNPPYQNENVGSNNQAQPVYNLFMDGAYEIAKAVMLITPARFLTQAGATPKTWNKKMLGDEHFKVISYYEDSTVIFNGVDIKGGIVITFRDTEKIYSPIDVFIKKSELRSIYEKIKPYLQENVGHLVHSPDSYRFTDVLFKENPELVGRTDKAHARAVASSVFDRYPEIFREAEQDGDVKIIGRKDGIRKTFYTKSRYLNDPGNLYTWKILIAGAIGTGTFGEMLSEPIVAAPKTAHTQTFVSMGEFKTAFEAESLAKYLKTKFLRALLGIMKTTQNNQSKTVWSKIPLQDFTPASDIDWSQPISAIDHQLYAKYGLDEQEVAFIESNVKEME